MIRVVPANSPMPELKGFLVEADEEDGYLYLTATNLECSIQRKYKAAVETGGGFVLRANLLLHIVERLSGEEIFFDEAENKQITIKSGNAVYTLPAYPVKAYPKPEMPFPEETITVMGLKELYAKTNFAASTDKNKPAFTGIHLEVTEERIRAVASDAIRMSLAEKKVKSNGKLSVTLPKTSLSYLVSAVGDDDTLECGFCGMSLVFMKSGMMFSTRIIKAQYIDADMLLSSVKPDYLAKVENQELKESLGVVLSASAMGTRQSPVKVDLLPDRIGFSTENDMGQGNGSVKAVAVEYSQNMMFWYPSKQMKDIFRVITGETVIMVSKSGYMVVMDAGSRYMLTPQRKPEPVQFTPKKKPKEEAKNKAA